MQDHLLTIDQLAELVGVSRATINRWRADGAAPAEIKLGKVIRFRREDVDAWLSEQLSA